MGNLVFPKFSEPRAANGTLEVYENLSSSTFKDTFDKDGATLDNPVDLDAYGEAYISYSGMATLVCKDTTGATLWTYNNVECIEQYSGSIDEWIASGHTPTYISATSFKVPGNQTTVYSVGQRIKTVNTAGTVYSVVDSVSFAADFTTLTLINSGTGVIDSGISAVSYALLAGDNISVPKVPPLATLTTTGGTEVLNAEQALADVLVVDGALTSALTIEYPTGFNCYQRVINNTTAQDYLTAKPTGGTGVPVYRGSYADVYSDGTTVTRVSKNVLTLHVRDEKTSGTGGGTSSVGNNIRNINTTLKNTIPGSGLVFDLAYDAQTTNFTVGETLTGGTSGATATIVADNDGGATGTLKVINITGTFADNETITDGAGGSALANIPSGVVNANQVYVPAGTYNVWARAQATQGVSRLRLYDLTNTTIVAHGSNTHSATGTSYATTDSFINQEVTLSTAAILELWHYRGSAVSNGLGVAVSTGDPEVYAELKLELAA